MRTADLCPLIQRDSTVFQRFKKQTGFMLVCFFLCSIVNVQKQIDKKISITLLYLSARYVIITKIDKKITKKEGGSKYERLCDVKNR